MCTHAHIHTQTNFGWKDQQLSKMRYENANGLLMKVRGQKNSGAGGRHSKY